MSEKLMGDAQVHPEFVDEFSGEAVVEVMTPFKRALERLFVKTKQDPQEAPSGAPSVTVEAIRLDALRTDHEVFQPRKLKPGEHHEDHVRDLKQGWLVQRRFDPIVVFPMANGTFIVVDGHHRVEALKLINAERQDGLPATSPERVEEVEARVWDGNLRGAVLYARLINSKATRSLAAWERSEAAWQMVLSGSFTNKQIATATMVSLRTVKNMNAALKRGGPKFATVTWAQARKGALETFTDLSEQEKEELLDDRADELWKRLAAAAGPLMQRSPPLLARAFIRNAPKLGEEVAAAILGVTGIEIEGD
jgi:ParB-like chromosome segregation protein Spo0J